MELETTLPYKQKPVNCQYRKPHEPNSQTRTPFLLDKTKIYSNVSWYIACLRIQGIFKFMQ